MRFGMIGVLVGMLAVTTPALAKEVGVCENTDGSIAIVHWVGDNRNIPPHLEEASCQRMDSADLPGDRTDRHAWRLQGDSVVVDATVPEPAKRARRRGLRQKLSNPPFNFTEAEIVELLGGEE